MEDALINTSIDRGRHRVLVVDDNPTTRYATARVVRAAGFQTEEASTGQEALRLSGSDVSAVVLDVHLPDLSGFEVCRAIRSKLQTSTLPVIHLSAAFVRNEDKVAGLDAGADAYLVHPVEPAVLIATLQALIRARMAEDRLRSSEARFRAIYQQAPTGMALFDAAGRFEDANPALERILQRPAESLIGQPLSALAPPEWRAFVDDATGADAGIEVWHGEFPLLRPDGARVRLEWTLSSAIEPGLRIGIAVDASERYELEQRRADVLEREQAARVAAERHSRTKDDFVAVLSHELRNPLNAIAGWVHLLQSRPEAPALLQKGLVAIDRSVKTQALLISDILDVSRINSGKLHLHREWIDGASLVTAAIDALAAAAGAKRIAVRFSPAPDNTPVWLDPIRYQQIVWNLLSNAIKFSMDDGVVDITLIRAGENLTLAVRDHGRGIPAEFVEHLFDRFSQSDSPDNRTHGGLGLGLSIVRNLAELHGGQVHAASDGEGRGATLTVTLPVVPPTDSPVHDDPARLPSTATGDNRVLSGMEVLIVEDNADASEILMMVLADAGARVRLAADYLSALQLSEQRWPDILVSDIGLPGRDGYELVRQLRHLGDAQSRARFFAVALTAFSRNQDRAKALESGFDAHLAKPLQPHALLALVAERGAPPPARS